METANDIQQARGEVFKKLHERTGIFVIPNPWDAGSARILESLGFEALATTSAGLAFAYQVRVINFLEKAIIIIKPEFRL